MCVFSCGCFVCVGGALIFVNVDRVCLTPTCYMCTLTRTSTKTQTSHLLLFFTYRCFCESGADLLHGSRGCGYGGGVCRR